MATSAKKYKVFFILGGALAGGGFVLSILHIVLSFVKYGTFYPIFSYSDPIMLTLALGYDMFIAGVVLLIIGSIKTAKLRKREASGSRPIDTDNGADEFSDDGDFE